MLFRMHLAAPIASGAPMPRPTPAAGPGLALPPNTFPPPGARPYGRDATVNIVGVASATPAGLHLDGERGFITVIDSVDLFIDAPDAATVVLWTFLAGGVPVNGLASLRILPRVASSLSRSLDRPLGVEIPPGVDVDVRIDNVDGAGRVIGASYRGWRYAASQGGTNV